VPSIDPVKTGLSEPTGSDFLDREIRRYRKRIVSLRFFHFLIWEVTLLGLCFSLDRFAGSVLAALLGGAGGLLIVYRFWYRCPGLEEVVRRVDRKLASREGLITAFQFRESLSPCAVPLARQAVRRLAGASPSQVFPWTSPKILWAWPILFLALGLPKGVEDRGLVPLFSRSSSLEGSAGPVPVASREVAQEHRGTIPQREAGGSTGASIPQKGNRDTREMKGDAPSSGERSGLIPSRLETPAGGAASRPSLNRRESGGAERGDDQPFSERKRDRTGTGQSATVAGAGIPSLDAGQKEIQATGPSLSGGRSVGPPLERVGGGEPPAVRVSASSAFRGDQVYLRPDLPEDYRDYVKRYFDTVQEGEGSDGH
jgi:hypothetical protein